MDRQAVARECERIEQDGGDVLGYLRARGCVSPWGTWYRLQKEELHRRGPQITDGKEKSNMSNLMERLDNLRILIQDPNFLEGKGLSNGVNIRIFCYKRCGAEKGSP